MFRYVTGLALLALLAGAPGALAQISGGGGGGGGSSPPPPPLILDQLAIDYQPGSVNVVCGHVTSLSTSFSSENVTVNIWGAAGVANVPVNPDGTFCYTTLVAPGDQGWVFAQAVASSGEESNEAEAYVTD